MILIAARNLHGFPKSPEAFSWQLLSIDFILNKDNKSSQNGNIYREYFRLVISAISSNASRILAVAALRR